jgi:hypothetical protein
MIQEKQERTDAGSGSGGAPMESADDQQQPRRPNPHAQAPGAIGTKQAHAAAGEGTGAGAVAPKHPRSAQSLTYGIRSINSNSTSGTAAAPAGSGEESDGAPPDKGGAVGSGLAAIRRRTRSLSQTPSESGGDAAGELAQQRLLAKQHKDEEVATEEAVKGAAQREQRKAQAQEQQSKLSSYLTNLTEQRKQEELDRKKKEERAKKRMALLSNRLLQEAAERKLMQQHDTWEFANATGPVSAAQGGVVKPTVAYKPRPPAAAVAPTAASSATAAGSSTVGNANQTQTVPPKAPRKVKITAEMTEKLVSRLQTQSSKISGGGGGGGEGSGTDGENGGSSNNNTISYVSNVPCRDFADWKRKNGVPADGLVFAMTGWYPCVRDALLARGWYHNTDPTSTYFNLKWTLRSLDVSQEALQPWQLTNHYLKNVAITTKAGLIKSLQSLVWTADVEANDIIPRGYDLSNNGEMQAFLDDFRTQKAESVLKALYLQLTGLQQPVLGKPLAPIKSPRGFVGEDDDEEEEEDNNNEGNVDNNTDAGEEGGAKGKGESKASTTKSPKQKNEKESVAKASPGAESGVDMGESLEIPPLPALAPGVVLSDVRVNVAVFEAVLSVLEKQVKPHEDSYIDDRNAQTEKMVSDLEWEIISQHKLTDSSLVLPAEAPEPVDAFLKEKEDTDTKPTAAQTREKRRQQKLEEEARELAVVQGKKMRALTVADLERVHYVLCSLMHYNRYQTGLNGKGNTSYNMWIVKPAAKSRGRGISTFMDLQKLLKYVDAGTGRYSQWVVQKYMENPLIIAKRKFDLRQWVVVTNWNPLTIYFYDECYARFSVDEYSTSVNDLENSFVHLVNNSIGKNSEKFNDVIIAENGEKVEGYMWSFDQVGDFIKHKTGGSDLLRTKVHPRMKVCYRH